MLFSLANPGYVQSDAWIFLVNPNSIVDFISHLVKSDLITNNGNMLTPALLKSRALKVKIHLY
jgi:hypothetical protein